MGRGKHLTKEERDKISVLQSSGIKQSEIAREIGRSKSTISKELNKETSVFYRDKYIGSQSHKNVQKKWKESHKRKRMNDLEIQEYVIDKLKLYWTPEQISGRIELDIDKKVSHETIYMWIYRERPDLTEYLPRKQTGRKKRNYVNKSRKIHIPNRTDIDLRPKEAEQREVFGHFEADTIVSKKSLAALLVTADRASRKTGIKKLTRKTAEQASNAIIFALKNFNTINLSTITYDNGSEFCYHEKVNQELGTKSYFCKPYHSWEKGMVENINGLIRRFFPKGTDFDTITEKEIQQVENWINNRPMKVLGWKTPNEKYEELMTNLNSVSIAS
jgi:transposase, IS30 family